jgi:hypothetical protein
MRRIWWRVAVGSLCVVLSGTVLTGCGGDRKPPIVVPDVPSFDNPVPSTSESPPPSEPETTTPTTPPPTTPAKPPPLAGAGTADVKATKQGGTGHLGGVRLAKQFGYDRLVLEFNDRVPGYTVGYRPLPAHTDGSGAEIPLPGATAQITMTLTPASAHQDGTGAPTYTGPSTVSGGTAQVTQARSAGDFEAVVTWVVGVRKKSPFKVSVLADPPRLVLDVQH